MNSETLLRAVRDVFALVPRTAERPENDAKLWAVKLEGLHSSAIKSAASALRKDQKRRGQSLRDNLDLKVSNLPSGIAQTMGPNS